MTEARKAPSLPRDRFSAFVWISAGAHLLAFLVLIAWSIGNKPAKPKVATFEMVGAKGDGGESPAPLHAGPVKTQEQAPAVTKAPESKSPSKPVQAPSKPTPTAKPTPLPVPTKTPAAPPTATPVPGAHSPSSGTATTGAAPQNNATGGTGGSTTKAGSPGSALGDTLSIGAGQGPPSVMSRWLSMVKSKVEANWRAPEGLSGVKQMPEIVFQIDRGGRPSMVQLKVRSGNASLDRLALRAVQAVEMFPPVPDPWPEDKVVIRYVLQYASP
jgi:TonB family protein